MLLDLLRTIAITLLLLGHLSGLVGNSFIRHWFGWQHSTIPAIDYGITFGQIAITMFLVVSGIALELNYRSRKYGYGEFMVNRILRIYPIYYLALLVGIVMLAIGNPSEKVVLTPTVPEFLWSLSGFQAFTGRFGGAIVGTAWFIGLIMTLYLLYPFLSRAVKRWPHITIILALSLTVLSRYIVGRWDILPGGAAGSPLKWFPLCQLFWFVLGIYLVRVLKVDFWLCMNRVGRIAAGLAFASELSFPLFLVHFPLLRMVLYHDVWGLNESVSILVWFIVSILISWLIVVITNRFVPRKRIVDSLD